jgi:hypothetical protein
MVGLPFFALVTLGMLLPASAGPKPAEQPKHWVAVMYFHRTQRCPTCQRISAYIEEAVKTAFAREMKQEAVRLYLIDYQDKRNAKHTKCYKITRPTLILANVEDGRVTAWKPMPKVWSLVGKKDEFSKYVQDGVRGYLEAK